MLTAVGRHGALSACPLLYGSSITEVLATFGERRRETDYKSLNRGETQR